MSTWKQIGRSEVVRIPCSCVAVSEGENLVEAALARCGLGAETPAADYTIAHGETLTLAGQAVGGRALRTADLRQFKRWIGVPDARARRGPPAAPRLAPEAFDAPSLDAESRRELFRCAAAFVAGDSAPLAAYQAPIERHFGPFEARVVRAHTLHIESGGRLVLSGLPVILIAEQLTIEPGGKLISEVVSHITVGHLRKIGRACAH